LDSEDKDSRFVDLREFRFLFSSAQP
jgi:hypothetical protein